MSQSTLTLELPDDIYERVRRAAKGMNDRDQQTLHDLRAAADRVMLKRSYAYLLLKYRGHAIPNLGDARQ